MITEELILTLDEIEQAVRYFQVVLRLQDWDITVIMVDQSVLEDKIAKVATSLNYKEAEIQISSPDTVGFNRKDPWNMLQTVIHELLHIMFHTANGKFNRGDYEHSQYEAAIERLAFALRIGYPNWRDTVEAQTI